MTTLVGHDVSVGTCEPKDGASGISVPEIFTARVFTHSHVTIRCRNALSNVAQIGPPSSRQANTREVDMFARKVAARLKPNSLTEFTNLMECEILSWLRKQEGSWI